MTKDRLDQIKARAAKASKGPWMRNGVVQLGQKEFYRIDDASERTGLDFIANPCALVRTKEDADLVAESRTDVEDLLAEIQRLENLVPLPKLPGQEEETAGLKRQIAELEAMNRETQEALERLIGASNSFMKEVGEIYRRPQR